MTEYFATSEKVWIGAGTALKFGFFAAFGVFLFYLILSVERSRLPKPPVWMGPSQRGW